METITATSDKETAEFNARLERLTTGYIKRMDNKFALYIEFSGVRLFNSQHDSFAAACAMAEAEGCGQWYLVNSSGRVII